MKDLQNLTQALIDRLFVPVEASGRHVHLTKQQALALFGHPLTPQRPLSQPGQYLARERVTVVGSRGTLEHVAVLGPERSRGQVEISLTDGRTLGVEPPIRLSGDTRNTPGIRLRGPAGEVTLEEGVIAARRHIHLTPEDARVLGVRQGDTVSFRVYSGRPVIFEDVAVRVSPEFARAAHLDYDEANACGFRPGDLGRIL